MGKRAQLLKQELVTVATAATWQLFGMPVMSTWGRRGTPTLGMSSSVKMGATSMRLKPTKTLKDRWWLRLEQIKDLDALRFNVVILTLPNQHEFQKVISEESKTSNLKKKVVCRIMWLPVSVVAQCHRCLFWVCRRRGSRFGWGRSSWHGLGLIGSHAATMTKGTIRVDGWSMQFLYEDGK